MSVELICRVIEFRLIRSHLIVALLKLTHYFIPSVLNALNLSFLTFDICLDLSHLVHELIERLLDLLSVSPQLLRLLPHFHIHALKDLLFLRLSSLLFC